MAYSSRIVSYNALSRKLFHTCPFKDFFHTKPVQRNVFIQYTFKIFFFIQRPFKEIFHTMPFKKNHARHFQGIFFTLLFLHSSNSAGFVTQDLIFDKSIWAEYFLPNQIFSWNLVPRIYHFFQVCTYKYMHMFYPIFYSLSP